MKKQLLLFLGLFLLLVPKLSFAAPPDLIQGYENDLLVRYFIDGLSEETIADDNPIAMISKVFSIGLLMVGSVLLIYNLVTGLNDTGNTGEAMGKKGASFFFASRSTLGLGLLLPVANGFSAIQYAVFYLAKQGIFLGDFAWAQYVDRIERYFPSQIVIDQRQKREIVNKLPELVRMAACVDHLRQDGGKDGEEDAPGRKNASVWLMQPGWLDLGGMAAKSVASDAMSKFTPVELSSWDGSIGDVSSTPDALSSFSGETKIQFGTPNVKNYCGEITITPTIKSGNGAAYKSITLKDTKGKTTDYGLFSISTGDKKAESARFTELFEDKKTAYFLQYTQVSSLVNLVDERSSYNVFKLLESIKKHTTPLNDGSLTFNKESKSMKGDANFEGAEADLTHFAKNGGLEVAKAIRDIADGYMANLEAKGEVIAEKVFDQDELKKIMIDDGIASAGAWYVGVLTKANAINNGLNSFPDMIISEPVLTEKKNGLISYYGTEWKDKPLAAGARWNAVEWLYSNALKYSITLLTEEYRNNVGQFGEDGLSYIVGTKVSGGLIQKITEGGLTAADLDMMRFDSEQNPVVTLGTIGFKMLKWFETLFSLTTETVPDGKGGFKKSPLAEQSGTILIVSLGALFPSIILVFYIPFMPLILWIGAIIGWITMLLQALFGAPMWALAHLTPSKENFIGRQGQGYMLILSLIIRPILMIIGWIVSVELLIPIGRLINGFFGFVAGLVINATGGGSFYYLIGIFAIMGIYAMILQNAVKRVFALMHVMPDSLLQWFGGPDQKVLGEYANGIEQGVTQGMQTTTSGLSGLGYRLSSGAMAGGAMGASAATKALSGMSADTGDVGGDQKALASGAGAMANGAKGLGDEGQGAPMSQGTGMATQGSSKEENYGRVFQAMKEGRYQDENGNWHTPNGASQWADKALTQMFGNEQPAPQLSQEQVYRNQSATSLGMSQWENLSSNVKQSALEQRAGNDNIQNVQMGNKVIPIPPATFTTPQGEVKPTMDGQGNFTQEFKESPQYKTINGGWYGGSQEEIGSALREYNGGDYVPQANHLNTVALTSTGEVGYAPPTPSMNNQTSNASTFNSSGSTGSVSSGNGESGNAGSTSSASSTGSTGAGSTASERLQNLSEARRNMANRKNNSF